MGETGRGTAEGGSALKIRRILAGLLFTALGAFGTLSAADAPQRIVSIGGSVTETIYALGAQEALVGVDTSSIYPEAATKLPQCGYQRMLSAEGVASLKPDLVILAGTAGPASALEQLEKLGVPMVRLSEGYGIEIAREHVLKIGTVLGREEAARKLVEGIDAQVSAIKPGVGTPRVLFVLSRGGGAAVVSGKGTAADAMIRLAGGENVGSGFEGYKPVSAEAMVSLDPEVVVTTSRTFSELGEEGLEKALPGFSLTRAGKAKKVVVMDDLLLLGFGPRVGEAVRELSAAIHTSAPSALNEVHLKPSSAVIAAWVY